MNFIAICILGLLAVTSLCVWLAIRESRELRHLEQRLLQEALHEDDLFADVLEFHRTFTPHLIGESPCIPPAAHVALRWRLVQEEVNELETAMRLHDVPEIADGICDSIYVLLGMAVTYGIDLRPVWREVHAANMRKTGGGSRADGKLLKPADWQPPDVAAILAKQGRLAA